MKVLVINSGSSSLKYRLYDVASETVLAKGIVERIGEGQGATFKHEAGRGAFSGDVRAPDHEAALRHMVAQLTHSGHGAVKSVREIDAVGHRVVHGGEAFVDSVRITAEVIASVEGQSPLAPLHNPPNLVGIRVAQELFPDVPHVAVFDTAFHQTMPPHAFLYGLPYEIYEQHHVRRYGFHGTSHRFVARRAAEMLGKPLNEFNGITCHLGNGCSMAAIRHGKSVDTTMGLTPLEGLMMGTRSGDLDPAIPLFLSRRLGITMEQVDSLLNRKGGMLGVSGVSNDARTLWEAVDRGDKRAALAMEMFSYRVKKYLGAYLAVLNGCDAVVFTGGIGERDTLVRASACSDMEYAGILLDEARNTAAFGKEAVISKPESKVALLVVPTNEELEIARDAARIASL